jgi:hypothetical protein
MLEMWITCRYEKYLQRQNSGLNILTRIDVVFRATPSEILTILKPYEGDIKLMRTIYLDIGKSKESLINYLVSEKSFRKSIESTILKINISY